MNKILFALFVLFVASNADVLNKGCQYVADQQAIYNLLPFSQGVFNNITDIHNVNNYVNFSMCTRQIAPCNVSNPTDSQLIYGVAYFNGICYDLTDAVTSPTADLLDESDPGEGVVMTYATQQFNGSNNTLIVYIGCDNATNDVNITWNPTFEFNHGNNTIIMRGAGWSGCPALTIGEFNAFVQENRWIFFGVLFGVGLFVLLFGLKLFNVTIFMITGIVVFLVSGVAFYELTTFGSEPWVKWVVFGTCVVLGCLGGFVAVKIEKFGFFILGFVLGGLLGLLSYNLYLHTLAISDSVLYCIILGLGLIGGCLALWLYKEIIIIGTSVIGAYLSVRAVSMIVGGFQNEFLVAEGLASFTMTAYLYMAGMVVVAIGGIIFQMSQKKSEDEKERTASGYKAILDKQDPNLSMQRYN